MGNITNPLDDFKVNESANLFENICEQLAD